jgi:Protein of unknown function (DUF2946)
MDDLVKAGLKKWPGVPHCYGWLALDARGDWYLRDESVQAAGPFPAAKGSRIEHDGLREFIQRNYAHDEAGGWYFQNGPQRVYVELEAAPWVWRLESEPASGGITLRSHTGSGAMHRESWLDEQDRLFFDTDIGFGLVHTLDTGLAAQAIDRGLWPIRGELAFEAMPGRFGYVLRPTASGTP